MVTFMAGVFVGFLIGFLIGGILMKSRLDEVKE